MSEWETGIDRERGIAFCFISGDFGDLIKDFCSLKPIIQSKVSATELGQSGNFDVALSNYRKYSFPNLKFNVIEFDFIWGEGGGGQIHHKNKFVVEFSNDAML